MFQEAVPFPLHLPRHVDSLQIIKPSFYCRGLWMLVDCNSLHPSPIGMESPEMSLRREQEEVLRRPRGRERWRSAEDYLKETRKGNSRILGFIVTSLKLLYHQWMRPTAPSEPWTSQLETGVKMKLCICGLCINKVWTPLSTTFCLKTWVEMLIHSNVSFATS